MGIKPKYNMSSSMIDENTYNKYVFELKHKEKTVWEYDNDDVNPQPNNYKIVKAEEVGDYLVIKINYPNCTNFEGNKILVFKATLLEIVNHKDYKSPVARFVPTDDGWKMAVDLVTYLEKK